MKTLIMIAALLSLSAFAQESQPAAAPAVAPEAAPAKVEKMAKKAHHKMAKAKKEEAKAACLQENPALEKDKKGLKACVKGKM